MLKDPYHKFLWDSIYLVNLDIDIKFQKLTTIKVAKAYSCIRTGR